ncbi:inositol monophosphatase family protein [Planctomycetaceae bacterium SH139]
MSTSPDPQQPSSADPATAKTAETANAAGPTSWGEQHGGRLAGLVRLGEQTAAVTLRYFRDASLAVEAKADESPVTIADREAESEFRRLVSEQFAEDAVLGEEHEDLAGTSGYRWVVDPIDGTKSFVAGVPMYSTLVALEYEDRPIAGGIWIPALGEVAVAAAQLGCWYRPSRGADWQVARVSSRDRLDRAIFVTTAADSFAEVDSLDRFERLQQAAWFTRTWGDGYGYLLVATGRADLMVDPIVSPWDIAAIAPVIIEAGGLFSDWQGVATTKGTQAVGTNGILHAQILELLS